MRIIYLLFISALLVAPAIAQTSTMSADTGYGPNPYLPDPSNSLIPTVNTADPIGWTAGKKPVAPQGLMVNAFADHLDHPRWVYVLPNGDVLVAETNAPPKPEEKGIKNFVAGLIQEKAGAKTQSANRITLLRDTNSDGRADIKTPFLENLYSPFGMALIGNQFYVANADAIIRFPYNEGDTKIEAEGIKITDLPGGPLNHHWTKNIIASKDGRYLYASIGSNSNVAENGLEKEEGRAAIHQIDVGTGATRVFATGLRNPVGMDWNPQTGELWTSVNERDELGDDLVPDYMTSVKDGGFYGWPFLYYGGHIDRRVETPDINKLIPSTLAPDYALGAHTASLGLTFYDGNMLPAHYRNGAFVGQHGSWNRNEPVGYKVLFVPFENGKPKGMPENFLTGFLNEDEDAMGRPVGVAVAGDGALLVADDVGNVIWRVGAPR